MRKITNTYYVCQYCGYKDTDDASMRKHESVCRGRVDIENLIGKWVQISEHRFFKIMEVRELSDTVNGIEISMDSISRNIYRISEIVNKPVSSGYMKMWTEWKKRMGEE